jgi:hypothetical protein
MVHELIPLSLFLQFSEMGALSTHDNLSQYPMKILREPNKITAPDQRFPVLLHIPEASGLILDGWLFSLK